MENEKAPDRIEYGPSLSIEEELGRSLRFMGSFDLDDAGEGIHKGLQAALLRDKPGNAEQAANLALMLPHDRPDNDRNCSQSFNPMPESQNLVAALNAQIKVYDHRLWQGDLTVDCLLQVNAYVAGIGARFQFSEASTSSRLDSLLQFGRRVFEDEDKRHNGMVYSNAHE